MPNIEGSLEELLKPSKKEKQAALVSVLPVVGVGVAGTRCLG